MKRIKDYCNKLISLDEKPVSILNILIIYRYVSFLVCMVLYYITAPHSNRGTKIFIMCMLVIVYSAMGYLYLENRDDRRNTLILSIVEAVENSVFIVISGGFTSPFIWYFVSTVFITAVKISYLLAVTYSSVYFFIAALLSIYSLKAFTNLDVKRLHLNTAISCIIIVSVILQLIRYAGKVEEKTRKLAVLNCRLEEANAKVEETLKYSIEVYETINIFNNHDNGNILHKLLEHYSYISGIKRLLFIRLSPIDAYGSFTSFGLSSDDAAKVHARAMELIDMDNMSSRLLSGQYGDEYMTINYVMYEESPCGAFVALGRKESMPAFVLNGLSSDDDSQKSNRSNNIFNLFMKIASIAIKQMEFQEIEEQLLISEEQNRIAGEIHDVVLQRLFAISCKLYVMSRTADYTNVNQNLLEIKKSIDLAMKDLRETIYGLSWEKRGKDVFLQKLKDYTDELQKMHGVEIEMTFLGDVQMISLEKKRALYRIICEVINNAIRHGKANHIDVHIMVEADMIKVQIADNGTGFDYDAVLDKKDRGMGLNNINRIIEMMNGHISIKSGRAQSTSILMEIPCRPAV